MKERGDGMDNKSIFEFFKSYQADSVEHNEKLSYLAETKPHFVPFLTFFNECKHSFHLFFLEYEEELILNKYDSISLDEATEEHLDLIKFHHFSCLSFLTMTKVTVDDTPPLLTDTAKADYKKTLVSGWMKAAEQSRTENLTALQEAEARVKDAESKAEEERWAREDAEARADEERRAREEAETRAREAEQKHKYLPMVHGRATDSLASMVGETVTLNFTGETGTIDNGRVTLVIEEINKLKGTLGISTHKLLCTAITEFTKLNHTGEQKKRLDCSKISIPLQQYAFLCGHNVYIQETFTEEAFLKEKNRSKNAIKEARNKINKDLSLLFSASLSWSEKIGKEERDFRDIRIIEARGIIKGMIEIRFSQSFSEYLVKLPLTQYHTSLLSLDERNPNAYSLGIKISTHFNNDNNITQGTNNRLKIKTLLKIVNLPSYEKIKSERRNWEERIKEPLEESLEKLVSCGFLNEWKYCLPKGIEMTDEDATNFLNFQKWEDTLVLFDLKDQPNHEMRRENQQKRIAENKSKKRKNKPKKTTPKQV